MTPRADLTRSVLAILLMAILIGGSFWILRPFLLSVIWAVMIVVATWPMMLRLQARLGRRFLAVAIMSTVDTGARHVADSSAPRLAFACSASRREDR